LGGSYFLEALELITEVLNQVIIDAYEKDNPQVDKYEAASVLRKVRSKVEDDYKSLKPGELQTSKAYEKFCDVRIKFYELISTRKG